MDEGSEQRTRLVGDLIEVARAPAVVSLADVEGLRDRLGEGGGADEARSLLAGYSLAEPETRAAFEAITRSLARDEARGDAFLISGVYGSGKSHLLAAVMLLSGHPRESWPHFLSSHPGYDRVAARFGGPRLVVAIPLDGYSHTVPLEHIVLARLESDLARRHGVRVALTEESHLLDLVERYVLPQVGDSLDEAAGGNWSALRDRDAAEAARVALEFITSTGFPLDWRRSRAEAWGALRRALETKGIDGPLMLLDEVGLFLASKDRKGLNADASFLQYLAQRTSGERCWLTCVTQRGLEDVGDIDRRTLRQLRDRFRPSFTLNLAELGWVVQRRLVDKREESAFLSALREMHETYRGGAEEPFALDELAQSYPLNPLCLEALRRAAEVSLSQTRSAVRLLQEAAHERGWLSQPADRLITPDVLFDLFRGEMELSPSGRRHLHAFEAVTASASRIAPGQEMQLAAVMKALCVLGIGELRWSVRQLRASLIGCEDAALWRDASTLDEALGALYRHGVYVERNRREGEGADEYYIDVSSDASERIRQRLNELVREMLPEDSRVMRAALDACREDDFPLAGLAETRSISVEWWHARRAVNTVCRDLADLSAAELQSLAGTLESSATREDGWLFLASPLVPCRHQREAWREAGRGASERFAAGLVAWLPREAERGRARASGGARGAVADGQRPDSGAAAGPRAAGETARAVGGFRSTDSADVAERVLRREHPGGERGKRDRERAAGFPEGAVGGVAGSDLRVGIPNSISPLRVDRARAQAVESRADQPDHRPVRPARGSDASARVGAGGELGGVRGAVGAGGGRGATISAVAAAPRAGASGSGRGAEKAAGR